MVSLLTDDYFIVYTLNSAFIASLIRCKLRGDLMKYHDHLCRLPAVLVTFEHLQFPRTAGVYPASTIS